jgi:predicted DNA-binding transcriptional regulator AlpA
MPRGSAPRIASLEWHEQQELEAALQRFADLSSRAQVEAFSLMREYLDGGIKETRLDHQIARRKDALDALRQVSADLGLPKGQAPTTTQFRETAKRLGLDWSVSKVGRAWGKWRFACEAYVGHRLRRTARQQGVLDAHTGKRRVCEDYITGLRLWLETHPVAETMKAYEKWTREFNEVVPHNQKPVCGWATIGHNLRIGFHDALRVARGEVALVDVPKRHSDHTQERGPLASTHWIAGEYGLSPHHSVNVPRRPDFPKPVVKLSGTHMWLKEDVHAYFANKPFPSRQEFELQDEYLSLAELAALMGKKPRMISQDTLLPKPAGIAGNRRYWQRGEVGRWLQENKR